MRLFWKAFLIYFVLLIIITYGFAWADLVGNGQLTKDVLENIRSSFIYYFTDVLIYWWPFILIGGLILALLTSMVLNLYVRFTNKK